jgi:hypothetical protein
MMLSFGFETSKTAESRHYTAAQLLTWALTFSFDA